MWNGALAWQKANHVVKLMKTAAVLLFYSVAAHCFFSLHLYTLQNTPK